MPPFKNCWKYFPKSRGLVSGIIVGGFGFSAMIFSTIGDMFMNPERILSEKIGDDYFYPKKIADRVNY